ncbi:MAG: rod shape-determining protein MreC [Alphaproteobacteria bacterium]|nr:MAG: rod shape-determining protein MreC [Alphaproteobacteria bacterium]
MRDWRQTMAMAWLIGNNREFTQRMSFTAAVLIAVGMLFYGQAHPDTVSRARTRTMDAFAPLLDALSRPVDTMNQGLLGLEHASQIYSDNERLRAEVEHLKQWQQLALNLQAENASLRGLMNFKPDPSVSFISARVISDPGGPFRRSVIVTAGERDGVRTGLVAMSGDGVAGRVIESGTWSSRILLLTDSISRLPVTVGSARVQAILAGDGSARPSLIYLPTDFEAKPGDRVVTSGQGGIFPADLVVGVVADVKGNRVQISLTAGLDRLDVLRLVDFRTTNTLLAGLKTASPPPNNGAPAKSSGMP